MKKILSMILLVIILSSLMVACGHEANSNSAAAPTRIAASAPTPTPAAVEGSYYCDPVSGSMSNPGTLEQPWGKLEEVFAAGKTFRAGDTIYLMSGDHGFPVINQKNSEDVTITKYNNEEPIINRIDFDGASHWVLDDLEIFPDSKPPEPNILEHPVYLVNENIIVRITNESSYVTLSDCSIYSIKDSSSWTADDWNNNAWNGMIIEKASNHISLDKSHILNVFFGIHMRDSSHNTMRYCTIENFCGDGLRPSSYSTYEYNVIKDVYITNGNHYDAVQAFESTDVVFRGNQIICATSNHPYAGAFQAFTGFDGWHDNYIVENNLIVTSHSHGLTIYGARNCKVVNNTVMKSPIITSGGVPWISLDKTKAGEDGSNNIVRNNLASQLSKLVGCTLSNNIESTEYTTLFVDYEGQNFHLKEGSPAINAGTEEYAPSTDLDGNIRIAPFDVGAYEYLK